VYYVHYNFCRRHSSLKRQTPAMASGLTDHVWTMGEVLAAIAAIAA